MGALGELLQRVIDEYLSLRADWGVALDIFCVVFITGLLDLITRGLFSWLGRRVRSSTNIWDDALYYSFNGPLQGLIWVVGLSIAVRLGRPDEGLAWLAYSVELRGLILVGLFVWFLFRLISSIGSNALSRAATRENAIDATTADAIGKLLRIAVLITAALLIMQVLGVSPSALLAFSGAGGIAIGFAARDVLANIFGGLTVYLNRPFSVGDWIRSPEQDIEGVVEAIGWRATTVRRFDMRPLYVPNAVFSKVALENPSRMTHRRIMETVAVRYDDAAAIPDIVESVRGMLDKDEAIDSNQVILTYIDSFGDSAIKLLVYCYTHTTDWAEFLAIKQSVLQRVQDTVREHGAAIAYPTTTLQVPGELRIARAEHGDDDRQEEIDPNKVQSERKRAVSRENKRAEHTQGPDSPSEEGEGEA
ncbi:mechanosensitive ion channel family protein [Salinisphaera aquimarina]|uniref:Mechanosensitive ion channel family protein n=1 Tax=Salinisphaera aquimarina TaxID=2094031 RepID=A0ABV7ESB4_9GAMM